MRTKAMFRTACVVSVLAFLGVAVPAYALPVTSGLELWLDATDSSTLFQDAAMTTAVTAAGQNVRGWADKSGNANDAMARSSRRFDCLRTSFGVD